MTLKSDTQGDIYVGLKKDSGNRCILTVRDNGVGIPEEIKTGKPVSLGLQLINSLASQLSGTVEFKMSEGTCVITSFDIKKTRKIK